MKAPMRMNVEGLRRKMLEIFQAGGLGRQAQPPILQEKIPPNIAKYNQIQANTGKTGKIILFMFSRDYLHIG
jgi:hypothetical protein